jgi:small subunit ribosomal protein S2
MSKKYKLPSIEELIEARVHIGHQIKKWHPNMAPYIYVGKKGIHVVDLEKTIESLEKACDVAYEMAKEGKKIVFVGTKRQAKDIVQLEAKNSGAMHVTERWLGGTITNFPMLRRSIKKLLDHKEKKEKGEFAKYTKKERLLLDREIENLERYFGGLTSLTTTPDLLIIVDAKKEKTAVNEALSKNIPVIAIVDTNTDPKQVNFPIPGNDDAIRSIAILLKSLSSAVEAGYKEFADNIASKKALELEQAKKLEELKSQPEEVEVDLDKLTVTTAQAAHITKEAVEVEEPLLTQDQS